HLAYGYALFKLQRESEARTSLKESLRLLSGVRAVKRGKDAIIDFEPKRLRLIAYGLLAQIGAAAERAEALQARIELLTGDRKLMDDGLSTLVMSHARLADLYSTTDRLRAA